MRGRPIPLYSSPSFVAIIILVIIITFILFHFFRVRRRSISFANHARPVVICEPFLAACFLPVAFVVAAFLLLLLFIRPMKFCILGLLSFLPLPCGFRLPTFLFLIVPFFVVVLTVFLLGIIEPLQQFRALYRRHPTASASQRRAGAHWERKNK